MIGWETVAKDFAPDGSLRDVYVLETDLEDWERVMAQLRTNSANCSYSVDGVEQSEPPTAQAAFAVHAVASPSLRVEFGGIEFACHFFTAEEIEFDFLPNDIDGPDRFGSLIRFVESLGRTTGKHVVVTPENMPDAPFLRYDPSKAIVEHVDDD